MCLWASCLTSLSLFSETQPAGPGLLKRYVSFISSAACSEQFGMAVEPRWGRGLVQEGGRVRDISVVTWQ